MSSSGHGVCCSLPMYDIPELCHETDCLWACIARCCNARLEKLAAEGGGGEGARCPSTLDRCTPIPECWDPGRMLVSQTCGYPLTQNHRGQFSVLLTPSYDGCPSYDGGTAPPPGHYYSVIIVPLNSTALTVSDLVISDLRAQGLGPCTTADRPSSDTQHGEAGEGEIMPHLGSSSSRCGVCIASNGPDSHSGYNTLRATIAAAMTEESKEGKVLKGSGVLHHFGRTVLFTGSHAASLAAVQSGEADVAAIDNVTFSLLATHRPAAVEGVRIIGRTTPAPALPYVTSSATPPAVVEALRCGLRDAWKEGTGTAAGTEGHDPLLAGAMKALMLAAPRAGGAEQSVGVTGLVDIPYISYEKDIGAQTALAATVQLGQ